MTLSAIRPADFPWFPYEGFTFCLGLHEGERAWTSGHTSARHDEAIGKMTVHGSMEEQARIAYAKCLAILEAAGFGPEDVTRVSENITVVGLQAYDDAAGVRRELLGDRPTVRTVIVERLVRRAAWIEVELHAVKGGGTQLRAASEAREAGTWQASSITEGADGVVYLPTVTPVDEHGDVVFQGDFVSQYRYVLEKAGSHAGGGRAVLGPCGHHLRLLHPRDPQRLPRHPQGPQGAVGPQRLRCLPGCRRHPDEPPARPGRPRRDGRRPPPGTRSSWSIPAGAATTP